MIARASKLFLPTLRDDPADAEAVNHKLLVRGGFVRGEHVLVGEFTRPLERRHRGVVPDALQVDVARRRPRGRPGASNRPPFFLRFSVPLY